MSQIHTVQEEEHECTSGPVAPAYIDEEASEAFATLEIDLFQTSEPDAL